MLDAQRVNAKAVLKLGLFMWEAQSLQCVAATQKKKSNFTSSSLSMCHHTGTCLHILLLPVASISHRETPSLLVLHIYNDT